MRCQLSSSTSQPSRPCTTTWSWAHVLPANPAAPVRGLKHIVKQGKTPVFSLSEWQARDLLDSIDLKKPSGLRDWALLATMAYSFARGRPILLVGAMVGMKATTCRGLLPAGQTLVVAPPRKGRQVPPGPVAYTTTPRPTRFRLTTTPRPTSRWPASGMRRARRCGGR